MTNRSEIHERLFKSAELDLNDSEKNFLDEVDRAHKDQWAERQLLRCLVQRA